MKKVFKLLLVLFICLCLINTNNKHTKADGDNGTLYFGTDTSGKTSLFTDPSLTTEYTGNEGKWSASSNEGSATLTLNNDFYYEMNKAGESKGIDFSNAINDVTININGKVSIVDARDDRSTNFAAFNFNTMNTLTTKDAPFHLTIKGVGDNNVLSLQSTNGFVFNDPHNRITVEGDVLIGDYQNNNKLDKLIYFANNVENGTVKIDGGGLLDLHFFHDYASLASAIGCADTTKTSLSISEKTTIKADGSSYNALVKVGVLSILDSSVLNVTNQYTGSGIECTLPNTLTDFMSVGSTIRTSSNGAKSIVIHPGTITVTQLNSDYFVNYKDNSTGEWGVKEDAFVSGGDNTIYVGIDPGESLINYTIQTVISPIDTNAGEIKFVYNDDGSGAKWKLVYDNSGTYTAYPGRWHVEGDSTNPKLVLEDNFSIVTKNASCLYLVNPNGMDDVNLTIKVEGNANIFSTYKKDGGTGNESVVGIKTAPNTDDKYFMSITFEGNGIKDTTLNILPGYTDFKSGLYPTISGLYSDCSSITFKNGTFSLYTKSGPLMDIVNPAAGATVSTALVASACQNLNIDNAELFLTGGDKNSNLAKPVPDIYVGCGISNVNEKGDPFTINIKNGGMIVATASLASLYLDNDVLKGNIKATAGYMYDDADKIDLVQGKYGKFGYPKVDPIVTFYTYRFTPGGGLYYPCNVLMLTQSSPVDPSPSDPSKKDESCEKVIGPTWHWNNDKGICEDVGVVGTATR